MFDIFLQYLLFLGKAATLVLALGVCVTMVRSLRRDSPNLAARSGGLRTGDYSRQLLDHASALRSGIVAAGLSSRTTVVTGSAPAAAFVLMVSDESMAGRLTALKLEVNAILMAAEPDDIVIVRIKSTGGVIAVFGGAATQIERLRARGLRIVASIDEVATSGGYMIASMADEILATSFANVGGIGLIMTQLNFSSALESLGVKNLVVHAGQDKLSLDAFSANSDRILQQQTEHLEIGLSIWRNQLVRYRLRVDPDAVSTGRLWFGSDAVSVGLVDRIQAFDDFVLENFKRYRFIAVSVEVNARKSSIVDKFIRIARNFV